jgi:hypothetical protein
MDRHRYDAQAAAGKHHGDLGRPARRAAQRGQELGVAGVAEACVLQRLLLDRIGHDRGRDAIAGQRRATLDAGDDRAGVAHVGLAGARLDGKRLAQHRQRPRECGGGAGGRVDLHDLDRQRQLPRQVSQPVRIVDGEEGERIARRVSQQPGLQRQFAADAGRLAHGDGERRKRRRCAHMRQSFLMSMMALRRRSRM